MCVCVCVCECTFQSEMLQAVVVKGVKSERFLSYSDRPHKTCRIYLLQVTNILHENTGRGGWGGGRRGGGGSFFFTVVFLLLRW